jgi:7-keto-8-aminopelargonate synthetase-like enzyme
LNFLDLKRDRHFYEKMQTFSRLGSTGSRLLTRNSLYVEQLESEIAAYHGEEAGLIFASDYTANVGFLSVNLRSR